MTPILFLRHGVTDWNLQGRIQGRRQSTLTAAARRQLRGLALPGRWRRAEVYCSPLRRTRETARALGLHQARLAPELLEMRWGRWEGRRLVDLRNELGDHMAVREARGLEFRPDGGESPRQVQRRLRRWLVRRARLARPAIAITHKGVIRAVLALATGWSMQGPPPVRLDWQCGQVFLADRRGRIRLARANLPLARRYGRKHLTPDPRR